MGNSFSSDAGYNSIAAAATTTASNLHRILNATFGQQTYTKNALQDLIEDRMTADVVSMDELIAGHAEYRDSHGKAICILRSTSAITSVISSSIFIWMIMRSRDRLSTTQHRLLLGLCICDIISSLSWSTFNATAPFENDYMTWNARGNQATCTAQGFLQILGTCGGLYYNASLNIYFLAVVKYNKSEEFIRAKIEPFLHGVPIAVALSYSISYLVKKHYNDGSGVCTNPTNAPPHCWGYDVGEIREGFEIPCWRGIDGVLTAVISQMVGIFIPVLIIVVSLGMIYSAVRTQEKKLAKYGVGALRSNLQQKPVSTPQSSSIWGRLSISLTALSTSLKAGRWSMRNSHKPVTRSNNVQSQSRAVMHKAFGYTFAWFLSYGFHLIGLIAEVATGSYPPILYYLATIFGPLQGFFNLLIFMYPKIVAAKKSKNKRQGGETVSWCKAFSTAFWSRGKGDKNQGTKRSNLRGGTSNGRHKKKTKNEDAASGIVTSPMFGGIKKKKTKRTDTPHEEEKCEIQVPDNLNSTRNKAMYSATSTATYAPNMVPSIDTTTMRTVVEFDESVNVCNTFSNVVEDPDEDVMLNQDEEEGMEAIKEDNVDIVSIAADGLVSANVMEHEEIAMENQDVREDEMKMDDNYEPVRMKTSTGTGR